MNDRKGFGSNFGFLMAAVGSAVGLGNIWGFPNKMGANGGFPFLILYLALALCCVHCVVPFCRFLSGFVCYFSTHYFDSSDYFLIYCE